MQILLKATKSHKFASIHFKYVINLFRSRLKSAFVLYDKKHYKANYREIFSQYFKNS